MARGIWKGSLGFGLVTIGVELFNAEAPERLDLDMLDKRDMSRIGYLKINKTTGKPVDAKDIVKGYEITTNRYVLLTPEDIKEANPKATQTIDVFGFVAATDIPLPYYAKPYIVAPTKGSEKAYLLFRNVLDETDRVALANVVHAHAPISGGGLSVRRRTGGAVAALRRGTDQARRPRRHHPEGTRQGGAPAGTGDGEEAGRRRWQTDWNPSEYRDEYRDDLLKLIKQRAKGAKAAHEAPAAPARPRSST